MSRQPTIVAPGEGPTFAVVGDHYRFLAVAGQTEGRYAIWHAVVHPGGGPPPHVHSREEEGFYVLSGEVAFYADGNKVVGTPGTFLNLPVGCEHRFQNETDAPAEMLILVAPAGVEAMFTRVGVETTDTETPPGVDHDEITRLLAIAPEYGIEIRHGQT